MLLLDLPPEVFQRVITEFVVNVGLCEAWKRRGVCKTFDVYITEEVFGKQPLKVYKRVSSKHLLRKGMSKYLEHRSRALYGAHAALPTVIRKLVDRFSILTDGKSNATHTGYTRRVSGAVAKYGAMISALVISPRLQCYAVRKLAADNEDGLAMCVAVAIEDVALVNALDVEGVSIWARTNLLGFPLSVAIRTRNESMIALVLELMEPEASNTPSTQSTKVLEDSLETVMDIRQWDKAINLAEWYFDHLGTPKNATCSYWFSRANSVGEVDFIRALFNLGYTPRLAALYRLHFLRSWSGYGSTSNILRLLMEQNLLKVSEPSYKIRTTYGTKEMSLLECAMDKSVVDMRDVQFLLEAGADPDGIEKRDGTRSYPLRAIPLDDREILTKVQMLLEYGADPEAGNDPNDANTLTLFNGNRPVRRLLYHAIKKKMKRLGEDYEPPRRWRINRVTGERHLVPFRLPSHSFAF